MRTIATVLLATVVAASSAMAQTSKAPAPAPSVAGDWDASYNTPGGTTAFSVTFVVNGEKLSGTVHRASGAVSLEGAAKGDSVNFVYFIQYNDHALAMTINAKVVGDAMKGSVDFGGQGQDVFEAKRASAAPKKPAPQH
jgi:hypothetical protein